MTNPTPGRLLLVRFARMDVRCDTCPTTISTGTPLVRAAGGFTICTTCAEEALRCQLTRSSRPAPS